jgi:hypothetical protein
MPVLRNMCVTVAKILSHSFQFTTTIYIDYLGFRFAPALLSGAYLYFLPDHCFVRRCHGYLRQKHLHGHPHRPRCVHTFNKIFISHISDDRNNIFKTTGPSGLYNATSLLLLPTPLS